ncbi:MAG: hypothetical protein J0I12_16620 [Candidatus Eremiobacteraeota bacterium]|nr:hypothetical protein [Candidatus Eremiobacteraeota bacterium]
MSSLIPTANNIPPWLQPTYSPPGGFRPHVSVRGPVNLMMSANPDLTYEQAQDLLQSLKTNQPLAS